MVLASVAYPLVWVLLRTDPVPTPWWLYNGAYPLLLAVIPRSSPSISCAERAGLARQGNDAPVGQPSTRVRATR